MGRSSLPIGCSVRIEKPDLQAVIDRLQELGYRVVGPRVAGDAIILGEIGSIDDLPVGFTDEQEPGKYRLAKNGEGTFFDYVVGPHSLKPFVFTPQSNLMTCRYEDGKLRIDMDEEPATPVAVLGVRSCDLHALEAQDRVFLGDRYVNPAYQARRASLFLVAVQCGRAAPTCFCTSMGTGPAVAGGFDLCLTEMPSHFLVEVGTERGGEVISVAPVAPVQHPGSHRRPASAPPRPNSRWSRGVTLGPASRGDVTWRPRDFASSY